MVVFWAGEDEDGEQLQRHVLLLLAEDDKQRDEGMGWGGMEVEKRVSPLRCSQKREQLRSK